MTPQLDPHGYQTDSFSARDGTRLAYQWIGDGPPVIFANGLGGTFHAWRHLYRHLAPRHRVVSWDYRCTHGSATPRDVSRITLGHSVDDVEDLCAHLGISEAVILGWSMGVQLSFELYRRRPELVRGIGALDGTAGRTFEAVNARLVTRAATSAVIGGLRHFGGAVGALAQLVSRTPHFMSAMKAIGIVNRNLDAEVFYDLCVDYAQIDFVRYAKMLELLDQHDAWDVLPTVRVPCTVVVGDRDFMTPPDVAERMCRMIPNCELVVLPGCTHYAAVEDPQGINRAVDDLLARCALSR